EAEPACSPSPRRSGEGRPRRPPPEAPGTRRHRSESVRSARAGRPRGRRGPSSPRPDALAYQLAETHPRVGALAVEERSELGAQGAAFPGEQPVVGRGIAEQRAQMPGEGARAREVTNVQEAALGGGQLPDVPR